MTGRLRSRFFINNLSDYQGQILFDESKFRDRISSYTQLIKANQGTTLNDCDGGLYVGVGGIAYMFHKLAKNPKFESQKIALLQEGYSYLNTAISYVAQPKIANEKSLISGFLLGNAGVHAVAAVYFRELGNSAESNKHLKYFINASSNCLPINFLDYGGDELLVGRAGYLSGCLWLNDQLGDNTISKEILFGICQAVYDSGKIYSRKNKCRSPLMYSYYKVEYLGAAHGLSSILQMLLSCPEWLKRNPQIELDVRQTIDYLLSTKLSNGNYPAATDEISHPRPDSDELVHWCHGAPGVIYLFAKAYLYWNDKKYLDACRECGELIWKRGLLYKGPGNYLQLTHRSRLCLLGICHGIAGNGYALLLLYRLTGEEMYLHRAIQFANFLFTKDFETARIPDAPYSLYEGLAGTICYLSDLLMPLSGSFPFMDICKN